MSHDFDFWIGAREVIDLATGELAGNDVSEAHAGGQVHAESYSTPGGFAYRKQPDEARDPRRRD